jgi:HSP20 family protein
MRGLVTYHPRYCSPFALMNSDLNRLFNEVLSGDSSVNCCGNAQLDITINDKEVTINVDLPGVKKENIQTSIDGSTLYIKATREDVRNEENSKYFISERHYGEINRSVELPVEVDSKKAKANFADGVLTTVLPKSEKMIQQDIKID